MELIKHIIKTLCMMGLAGALLEAAAPAGGHKQQLRALVGLVTILALLGQIGGKGYEIDLSLPEIEENAHTISGKLDSEVTSMILSDAEKEYEEYFRELLNRNEIETQEVTVELGMNEEGEVVISEIRVISELPGNVSEAEELIRSQLPYPEQISITVTANEIV